MASVDRLSVITMNLNVKQPLTTEFLLVFGDQEKPCPSFYGKEEDKEKVCNILKEEIHPEVRSKWGQLKCHCQMIPKIRLIKTAKNLNKVFLTCGASAASGSRCKFFQWTHTPMYPPPSDPIPDWLQTLRAYKPRPLKSVNKESQEWLKQAEQNVSQWKKQQSEKAWLNQFADTTRRQDERWEAKKKDQVLPSTFHWSPEIAKIYKKQMGGKTSKP